MPGTFKHSFKQSSKDIISLTVYSAGYQKCTPLYKWGSGIRDHYLIHHIISGKGYYQTGNTVYELHRGDTFIIYPYTEVSYWADENDPWEYYWVGFYGGDSKMLLKATAFSPENPVISVDFGNSLKSALYKIYRAKGSSYGSSVCMTGYLYVALSAIINKSKKNHMQNVAQEYARLATDYIAHNYANNISVETVSEYVGIGRSHLFRIFRACYNISPEQYIIEYRIRQACDLLSTTVLSVGAIANSVGYNNNLYFSKAFRKIKNMSPTEYREKHNK